MQKSGVLLHARYRSAWLICLRFRSAAGHTFTETVWRDAVPADVFSRLHFAAAYDTQPPGTLKNNPSLSYTERLDKTDIESTTMYTGKSDRP